MEFRDFKDIKPADILNAETVPDKPVGMHGLTPEQKPCENCGEDHDGFAVEFRGLSNGQDPRQRFAAGIVVLGTEIMAMRHAGHITMAEFAALASSVLSIQESWMTTVRRHGIDERGRDHE